MPQEQGASMSLIKGDHPKFFFLMVGGTGIEPVAPAV